MTEQDFDNRITFHGETQVMEADFSDFQFESSAIVNAFYDRIEERIAETGEELWFFLVNLCGTRIDQMAWIAYARRGKALNLSHSMGSVRFDASDITRKQIERDANTEAFDPNLFTNRDDAMARLESLPSKRRVRVQHDPNYSESDYARRISFDDVNQIMEVDFSHFTFHHSADVNGFYDHIEDRIKATDQKWFFLIDYNKCQIMPGAWVAYANRGKKLNIAASLGSVRYAAGSETEKDIRMRAETQAFRPNIRNTRDEAMALIDEMRETVHA